MPPLSLPLRTLETFLSAEVAAVGEHVPCTWVHGPPVALPRGGALVGMTAPLRRRDLNETVVERETVTNGVLPSSFARSIERKRLGYELVDFSKRCHGFGRILDSHGDETDVGERRLRRLLSVARGDGTPWVRVRPRGCVVPGGPAVLQGIAAEGALWQRRWYVIRRAVRSGPAVVSQRMVRVFRSSVERRIAEVAEVRNTFRIHNK